MARVLGAEHEHTLATQHEHARTLRDKGLLDEAQAVFERVSRRQLTSWARRPLSLSTLVTNWLFCSDAEASWPGLGPDSRRFSRSRSRPWVSSIRAHF
jgi:hypothetical protein